MRDPATTMQTLLQKHFPKFGGIRKYCNYQSLENPTYDPDTKTVTAGTISANEYLWIIFDSYSLVLVDDELILGIDKKAIFPALDLSVTPKINDIIVDGDLEMWNVIGVSPDPAEAHYELHVRPCGVYVPPVAP